MTYLSVLVYGISTFHLRAIARIYRARKDHIISYPIMQLCNPFGTCSAHSLPTFIRTCSRSSAIWARCRHVGVSVLILYPSRSCSHRARQLKMSLQDHHIEVLCLHFCVLMMFTLPLTIHVTIDLPPPKRRKTLAGSIVSTALSAALIGTAVGLTVYRL